MGKTMLGTDSLEFYHSHHHLSVKAFNKLPTKHMETSQRYNSF